MFRYKAVTSSDSTLEGEIEAASRSAVVERLHDLGQTPIRIEPVDAPSGGLLRRELFGGRGASRKEVGGLTRELASLLQAGLPLDHAFDVLINLAARDRVKALLVETRDRIRGGASLADALGANAKSLPGYYISMVRAGETSGSLESVLGRLADFMERSQALADRVRSALIYPAILLVTAGLSLVLLLAVVIPEFKPLFEDAGQALPLPTRVVVAAGDAFQAYWWAILLIIVAVTVLARVQLARPEQRQRWDRLLLRLPAFGDLLAKIQVARLSRLLGTLLANGVPVLAALSLVRDTLTNSAMAVAIDDVATRAKEGQGLARPLASTEMFPDLAVNLVRVGEETGQLEDMLARLADIYDREVQRALDRVIVIMVPAFTVLMGILIGGIVASVLLAILSVNQLAF